MVKGFQPSSEDLEDAGAAGHSAERDLTALHDSARPLTQRKLTEEVLPRYPDLTYGGEHFFAPPQAQSAIPTPQEQQRGNVDASLCI